MDRPNVAESSRRMTPGQYRLQARVTRTLQYAITSDSETEDYDDPPTIFYRAGQLPVEFDAMP